MSKQYNINENPEFRENQAGYQPFSTEVNRIIIKGTRVTRPADTATISQRKKETFDKEMKQMGVPDSLAKDFWQTDTGQWELFLDWDEDATVFPFNSFEQLEKAYGLANELAKKNTPIDQIILALGKLRLQFQK